MFYTSTRDLWDGIPEDIKEKAINNIINNLNSIGIREGHTQRKHIGLDEIALRKRLEQNTYLNVVSSFYDKKLAEAAIKLTMNTSKNKNIIKDWLYFSGQELVIDTKFKTSLGIMVKRGVEEVFKVSKTRIVLEKTETTDYGFRIKTAYLID